MVFYHWGHASAYELLKGLTYWSFFVPFPFTSNIFSTVANYLFYFSKNTNAPVIIATVQH